jgi:hypothetical protein
MATQDVDFKVSPDSDTNDTGNPGNPSDAAGIASIKNYSAGERIRAAVFNRPIENLRKRTETLRVETSAQKYLQDTDMRWIITGGNYEGAASGNIQPKVTWVPGTGKFTTSADIVLQPISGPKSDKKSSITYTKALNWSITLGTSLYRFEGGHLLSVRWQEADPGTLPSNASAVIAYEPYAVLVITLCNDGTTQAGDVYTALSSVGAGFTHVVTGTGAVSLSDILVDGVPNPIFDFSGTYDRELHHITPALFASFFATNTITSGDTLCLGYEWLVNPDGITRSGRRQSTATSGTSTVSLPGQLFLADAHPDRLPLAIPICKRIGDDLIFIDGTIARGDELGDVHFGMNGYTTQAFNATTAPSGASIIGVSAHTHHTPSKSLDVFDIAAGTLQATLELLQTFVNDKASLDINEQVDGEWIFNNTVFNYEPDADMTCSLIWRTGVFEGTVRPADAQIGWQTISKYGIILTDELFYITVQGAYIEWYPADAEFKIHTPATGTGNVYVNIESAGSYTGHAANNNIRGSRRLYNALANTRYSVFPSNWFLASSSGDIYYGDTRTMWATVMNLITPVMFLTATDLTITAEVIAYTPILESGVAGSSIAIHPAPTLLAVTSDVLGVHHHAFFNRVLDGFATTPAPLVDMGGGQYAAGHFPIDAIGVMGGRAIVAGNIITIPEPRVLTNVVNNYMLPNTPLPASSGNMLWYGLWLRKDGVFRVGQLPQYNLGVGIPGHTQYMLPLANIESTFDVHDYTLVNLVWSYQGNVAGQIRFAGIMHMGGNMWMYHQARFGTYGSPVVWSNYVDHRFFESSLSGISADIENLFSINTSYSGRYSQADGLPGVPAALTNVALINVRMSAHVQTSGNLAAIYLLNTNYPTSDGTVYSSSFVAPPNLSDPGAAVPVLNEDYDVMFTVPDPPSIFYYYSNVLFRRMLISSDSAEVNADYDDTVLYPVASPSGITNAATGLVKVGWKYKLSATDTFLVNMRTLGFMWDRYNAGGITI